MAAKHIIAARRQVAMESMQGNAVKISELLGIDPPALRKSKGDSNHRFVALSESMAGWLSTVVQALIDPQNLEPGDHFDPATGIVTKPDGTEVHMFQAPGEKMFTLMYGEDLVNWLAEQGADISDETATRIKTLVVEVAVDTDGQVWATGDPLPGMGAPIDTDPWAESGIEEKTIEHLIAAGFNGPEEVYSLSDEELIGIGQVGPATAEKISAARTGYARRVIANDRKAEADGDDAPDLSDLDDDAVVMEKAAQHPTLGRLWWPRGITADATENDPAAVSASKDAKTTDDTSKPSPTPQTGVQSSSAPSTPGKPSATAPKADKGKQGKPAS